MARAQPLAQQTTLIGGPYIGSLTVENVRAFAGPSKLILTDSTGKPCRWNVLLGANASGKSTLLSAISICMMHDKFRHSLAPDDLDYFARGSGTKRSRMELELLNGATKRIRDVRLYYHSQEPPDIHTGDSVLPPALTAAYSADRRWVAKFKRSRSSTGGSLQLLATGDNLIDAREWFAGRDFARRASGDRNSKREYDRVKATLIDVLPNVTDIRTRVVKQPRYSHNNSIIAVEFKIFGEWREFEDLSLGYQTFATWVVDFACQLLQKFPNSKNPLAEPAICLVDEIDLHMHPAWQREVIGDLTELFPYTQFIVTAHSPIVVQSALNANLVLLRRDGDTIVIENDPTVISTWRIDQLLTSDLFGLPSARPPEVETSMARRTELMQRKARLTAAEKAELKDLNAVADSLPIPGDGAQDRAREILKEAARRLGSTAFQDG